MIENAQGSTLPSTGGIGTKMFYLFGSAFVIGASTFIVTKKRVGEDK
jgi:LPXTG-motif cell wall-anchored protein